MANIIGTSGNDGLHDTSGNDTLKGGLGDDTLTVTGGYDAADGGSGTNLLVVDYSGSSQSFYTGPSYYGPGAFTDYQNIYSGRIENSTQTAGVVFTTIERFDITTGLGDDTLDLSKVTTNSHISTGAGDDLVAFHLGDTVDLGTGRNSITLDASSLTAPVVVDIPHGTYSGIPGLTGTLGYLYSLTTGSGDDSFILGPLSGRDGVYGGGGNDTFSASSGGGAFSAGLAGGDGLDKLILDFSADTAGDTMRGSTGGLGDFTGEGGTLRFYDIEQFDLKLGPGSDYVDLAIGSTTLHAVTGAGNDSVFGGAGSDSIDVGSGDNFVNSGKGADTIIAGDGDDVVTALDPDSIVDVGGGANIVGLDRSFQTQAITLDLVHGVQTHIENFSGTISGLSVFRSGSGNDSFNLGDLNSYSEVYGGAGDDTVAVTGVGTFSSAGLNGGAGVDTLLVDFSAHTTTDVIYGYAGSDGVSGNIQGNGYTFFNGFEHFDVQTGSGRDQIDLHALTTSLRASVGAGDDTLWSGSAADSLSGGAGNDTIYGGGGDDTIDGGTGADVAAFSEASTAASIRTENGAIVVSGPDGLKTLYGVEQLRFSDGTFDVGPNGQVNLTPGQGLVGGDGPDTLVGTAGNDTLSAGRGDDQVTGGPGSDTLMGGLGTDTAIYAGFAHDYAIALSTSYDYTSGGVAGGPEGGTDSLSDIEYVKFLDGTLTFDPDSTAAQIVRLYDSFLGRAPDVAGFDSYLKFFAAGHSFQDMANNAAASPEFHDATAALNDTQYITYVYEHSLRREPDPGGLQNYLDALHNGSLTRTSMIVQAAESPEHVALTAPQVGQGLWIPNEKVEGLELLYDAAVQRQPNPTGLDGYGKLLASGTTFKQIANQMAGSAEFQAAHGGQTDAQYIDSLYVAEVGRHADAPGLAAYLDELAHGHTRGDLLYETAMSQEHQSHVLAYYDPLLIGA